MLSTKGFQHGRISGKQVVNVADRAIICVMAGEEECPYLWFDKYSKGFVDRFVCFIRRLLFSIICHEQINDEFAERF